VKNGPAVEVLRNDYSPKPSADTVATALTHGGSRAAYIACCKLGGYKGGPKRAAYWRTLGFPNLVLARAARWEDRRRRRLEEWKREELRRTPFALLDDPPEELRPKKGRNDRGPQLSQST
jgi:hypothetical protein